MQQSSDKPKITNDQIARDPNTQHKEYPAQPAPAPGKEINNKQMQDNKPTTAKTTRTGRQETF